MENDRLKTAEKLSKQIQKNIDKLKKLNFYVDMVGHSIAVLDDNIDGEESEDIGSGYDFSKCIFFRFNTQRDTK